MKTTHRINLSAALALALTVTMTLFEIGAAQQTMNIEIDYMVLRDAQNNILHTHQLQPDERAAVVQMFACHGITLNIEIDDEIDHQDVICPDPNFPLNFWLYSGSGGFRAIRNAHFDHAGQLGWHYCVFAHRYSQRADCVDDKGSSGFAETPGDDFIVSLGSFANSVGTPFDRAATLAHEFGHNLGLRHCGNPICLEDDNYKPNFASIMNYRYQLFGVRENLESLFVAHPALTLFKNLDYSNGTMCSLNENELDETFGSGLRSVDWDCSGSISGTVSHDLNDERLRAGSWCNAASAVSIIYDYDEWSAIIDFTGKMSPEELDSLKSVDDTPCISYEEYREAARRGLPEPILVIENCINGSMVYLRSDANWPFPTGSCLLPFRRLGDAVASPDVPNGSVLYLRGGTYNETGAPLIIDRPLKITSVGTAVITVSPKFGSEEKLIK